MTEFARHFLDSLLRARAIAIALGIAVVVLGYWLTLAVPLLILLALFGVGLLLNFFVRPLQVRLGDTLPLHWLLLYDLVTIAVIVFMAGGLSSGFSLLYVALVVVAALLLGMQAAWRYVFLVAVAFILQTLLEALGIRSPVALPLYIEFLSQAVIIGVLTLVAFAAVQITYHLGNRWRQERAEAERASARWALINRVALRIQEATTPQQVYATIGEELHKLDLHCAILEWAVPGEGLQITSSSFVEKTAEHWPDASPLSIRNWVLDIHADPELARAVSTRASVLVSDALASARRLFPQMPPAELEQLLQQYEVQDLVYAPMVSHDQVSGVLAVWGKSLGADDVPALAALAQQVASAIEKAKLLAERQKRAAQLELANAIATQIGAAPDPSQVLPQIVQQIGERFKYHVVGILLCDWIEREVYMAAAYGLLSERAGAPYRQSIERGVIGAAIRAGKTYVANDVRQDPYYFYPLDGPDPVRAELVVPLHRNQEVIGVLDIQSTQPDAFDPSDVAAMEVIAEQLAVAMTKAEALAQAQRRAAQLELASAIAAQVNTASDDVASITTRLVREIGERFGYELVSIFMFDRARRELQATATYSVFPDLPMTGFRISQEMGILGYVARTGKPYLAPDVRADPYYVFLASVPDPFRSELAIPLRDREQVIGVLDLESTRVNAFDTSDVVAMEILAEQAAAALVKSERLAQERHRAAQLALVGEIAARATARAEPDAMLQTMVELVQERFGYHHVCVTLVDAEAGELELRAVAGMNASLYPIGKRWKMDRGLIALAAQTRQPVVSGDVKNDPRFMPDADEVANSELCVPLISGERVLGVLDVESTEREAFAVTDIDAMQTLANQIAVALEKARLFQSEARRAAELDTIRLLSLRLTAERDINALLHAIVESASELLRADGAMLFIVDELQGDLVIRVSHGLTRDFTGLRLLLGEGLAGRVAERGQPLMVPNYAEWEGRAAIFDGADLGQAVGIPLKWQERILGVITLYRHRERKAFRAEDQYLAGLFAAQAAIALENARLLEAIQARLNAQQILTEISRAFLQTTDSRTILERAAQAARRALNADSAILFFPDAEGRLVARAADGVAAKTLFPVAIPTDKSSVPGWVFATHQPTAWSDSTPLGELQIHPLARQLGFRAGLSVPMLVGERVDGVITVNTTVERIFNASDMQTLALLANQTAIALERATYFEEQQRRAQELNLLFESYRATSATLEPHQVMARLLEQLVRALDVSSGHFIRVDRARGQLMPMQQFFSDQASAEAYAEASTESPRADTLWEIHDLPALEQMLAQGAYVTQATDPGLPERERDYMRAQRVHTILRVPLRAADDLIGYISLWETRAPRQWRPEEIRFVETMASQGTAAFLNASSYAAAQERARELEALYEASRLLTQSLDVRSVCETSVDSLHDRLGYYHVSIYFVEDGALRLQVQRGYDNVLDNIPLERGIMARAVRRGETIFLPDVSTDAEFLAAIPNIQSEIAVPLKIGAQVLGVLNVETVRDAEASPGREVLTPADVRLLNTFANQLVAAIQNARLFEEAQQRLRETETLYAFARELSGMLNIKELAQRALEAAARLARFDLGEVSLVDESQGTIVPIIMMAAQEPPSAQELVRLTELYDKSALIIPRGRGVIGWVVEHGVAVRLGNVGEDPRYVAYSPRIRSEICLPLRIGERVIGVLNLESERPDAFDAHTEQLLTAFANQLAIAIENARLYEQTRREADVKAALLRELSHRVKNNLAAITSLLFLALDESPEAREEILHETLGRVQSMALTHALLARSDSARVSLVELGRQTLADTVCHLTRRGQQVEVQVEGDRVEVSARQASTLGLVLNELATNSLRHGFESFGGTDTLPHIRDESGTPRADRTEIMPILRMRVSKQGAEVVLELEDNGKGPAPGFDWRLHGGLGLNLIRTLVEKDLRGHFALVREGDWTRATVRFRLEA